MTQPTAATNITSSWKKTFFLIWTGQIFSLLGSGLVQFALVWYLTQTTGSAVVLASATMAAILPEIVLGPFAGALVDRLNRRLVMIVADGSIAVATVFLGLLFITGAIQIWHIYVILFLRSLGGVFHYNAFQASISLMVPESQLGRIAGLNQTLHGIMNIATPPLGALLLGLLPMYGILAIDVVTAMIAIGPLLIVRIPQPQRSDSGQKVTPRLVLKDMAAGLKYVSAWPGLLAILVMAMVINLFFNPAAMLMPLLVRNYFQGTAWHLSAIDSAWGIGAVAGGLLLSAWGGFKNKVLTALMGLLGMGLGALIVGITPANAFLLAVAAYTLTGFMNPIVNGPLFAALQAKVRPEMQGRVLSLVGSASMAMMPLGTLLAAPAAEWLGIQFWFVIGGLVTIAMGVIGLLLPVVMNFESDPAPQALDGPGPSVLAQQPVE